MNLRQILAAILARLTEGMTTRLIDFHWRHSLNHRLEDEWLKILLGEDVYSGEPLRCACNTNRYENGHMESCPLRDYPPEVLVIDWYCDFDRYCEEHGVPMSETPLAFAAFLAEKTGTAIVGGPVGEPPEFVAIPDPEAT